MPTEQDEKLIERALAAEIARRHKNCTIPGRVCAEEIATAIEREVMPTVPKTESIESSGSATVASGRTLLEAEPLRQYTPAEKALADAYDNLLAGLKAAKEFGFLRHLDTCPRYLKQPCCCGFAEKWGDLL